MKKLIKRFKKSKKIKKVKKVCKFILQTLFFPVSLVLILKKIKKDIKFIKNNINKQINQDNQKIDSMSEYLKEELEILKIVDKIKK